MTSNRKYSISKVDRRRFLTIFGATGAAALAGCAGGEADDEDGSSGGSNDDGGSTSGSSDNGGDAEEDIPTGDVELGLGETYEAPNAIEMTVNDFWFQESFTYEGFSGEDEEYPDDGNQWMYVDVTVLNGADESQFIPYPDDINVLIGNQQYDSVWSARMMDATDLPDEYEGGEVEAGIERSGIIMYEVPEDATEDDVVVSWSDEVFGEDEWTARWTN